ncbi:hypothetical protein DAPPUDRAFT_232858 [Daphnia pulex]|uniref:Uncharacterized protein n=1 Tax=Daphnia pulex TaxID=6669 RepID=E9FSJ5_DAPPU|nr:hypothetical protein DAPPUDRAFT_232858 [Daphnia pulex]|eukprot:EFX89820.1 hypothetical protein DAPPUDRAFT_232858 [Daphnia pulex]
MLFLRFKAFGVSHHNNTGYANVARAVISSNILSIIAWINSIQFDWENSVLVYAHKCLSSTYMGLCKGQLPSRASDPNSKQINNAINVPSPNQHSAASLSPSQTMTIQHTVKSKRVGWKCLKAPGGCWRRHNFRAGAKDSMSGSLNKTSSSET